MSKSHSSPDPRHRHLELAQLAIGFLGFVVALLAYFFPRADEHHPAVRLVDVGQVQREHRAGRSDTIDPFGAPEEERPPHQRCQ